MEKLITNTRAGIKVDPETHLILTPLPKLVLTFTKPKHLDVRNVKALFQGSIAGNVKLHFNFIPYLPYDNGDLSSISAFTWIYFSARQRGLRDNSEST
jgi:hypothetical protein